MAPKGRINKHIKRVHPEFTYAQYVIISSWLLAKMEHLAMDKTIAINHCLAEWFSLGRPDVQYKKKIGNPEMRTSELPTPAGRGKMPLPAWRSKKDLLHKKVVLAVIEKLIFDGHLEVVCSEFKKEVNQTFKVLKIATNTSLTGVLMAICLDGGKVDSVY